MGFAIQIAVGVPVAEPIEGQQETTGNDETNTEDALGADLIAATQNQCNEGDEWAT